MSEHLNLYGQVGCTEIATVNEGRQLHLCRGNLGDLLLVVDGDALELNRDEVRWLAGVLNGALDSWPVVEG